LESKLHEIDALLPVIILQTGDSSYFLIEKFGTEENLAQDTYQKIPRFVISFDGPQPMSDQNTNPYVKINFRKENNIFTSSVRRMAISFTANTDFVSSNFIKALEAFEIMSTITARPNCFTYEFMGNTYEGAYNISSNSDEKPPMDIGSGTRNFSTKTGFEVQLHLMVPRIETIKNIEDTGFDSIQFQIISKGENIQKDDISNLDVNK
jgi:hypothetical protein